MPTDFRNLGLEPILQTPFTTEEYLGTDRTVEAMEELARGARGEQYVPLRLLVEGLVREIKERDKLSQIAAIYHWFRAHYTFVADPLNKELVKDPARMTVEIIRFGRTLGDCDDASTWLLAAPRTIGIETSLIRTSFAPGGGSNYTHVLTAARDQYGRAIILDPVADTHTKEMLGRVTSFAGGFKS